MYRAALCPAENVDWQVGTILQKDIRRLAPGRQTVPPQPFLFGSSASNVWQYRSCSPLTQIKRAAGPILPDIPVNWNRQFQPTLCKIGFLGGVIAQGPLNFGRPCAVTRVRRQFLHKVATATTFLCGTRQAYALPAQVNCEKSTRTFDTEPVNNVFFVLTPPSLRGVRTKNRGTVEVAGREDGISKRKRQPFGCLFALERKTGLGPATSTLARLRSTN